MKQDEREKLIIYRLACAHEAVRESGILVQQELLRGATNRLYYAMFYSAIAALATRDVYPKTHKGVRQQLGLLFVVPGILSRQLGDAYSELFERRHSGDYDDFVHIDGETVTRLSVHAVELIEEIERIIAQRVL